MRQGKEVGKGYHSDWRRWCYGEGRRKAGLGIFLVIIGVLWLGAELGLFNSTLFWPLAFIGVGTWIVVSSLFRRKSRNRPK
jgi:hypothetical protein